MTNIEQLRKRLAAVETKQPDDSDRERRFSKIEKWVGPMLEAMEKGEVFDTGGDEDLIFLWREIGKVYHLLPQIHIPGVQNGSFKV